MDRNVFHVKPPSDENSKFVLLVSRGSGPFGSAPPIVFGVDSLNLVTGPEEKPIAMQGLVKRDGDTVVVIQFPLDTPYLLVERHAVSLLTAIEAENAQQAEEEEFRIAFPNHPRFKGRPFSNEDEPDVIPVDVSHPGQYA